jgi:hypothetical protein
VISESLIRVNEGGGEGRDGAVGGRKLRERWDWSGGEEPGVVELAGGVGGGGGGGGAFIDLL